MGFSVLPAAGQKIVSGEKEQVESKRGADHAKMDEEVRQRHVGRIDQAQGVENGQQLGAGALETENFSKHVNIGGGHNEVGQTPLEVHVQRQSGKGQAESQAPETAADERMAVQDGKHPGRFVSKASCSGRALVLPCQQLSFYLFRRCLGPGLFLLRIG